MTVSYSLTTCSTTKSSWKGLEWNGEREKEGEREGGIEGGNDDHR